MQNNNDKKQTIASCGQGEYLIFAMLSKTTQGTKTKVYLR